MNKKPPLTFAGRLLAVVIFLSAVAATWAYVDGIWDSLSPGRYPIWLFATPVILVALLLFWIAAGLLKLLGVPVYNDRDDDASDGEGRPIR